MHQCRMLSIASVIALTLTGRTALAQAQVIGVTVQISFQSSAPLFGASTELTSKASSAASSDSSKARVTTGPVCVEDKDCKADSRCEFVVNEGGRCVARPAALACVEDQSCPAGFVCHWEKAGAGHCAPGGRKFEVKCSSDSDCETSKRCLNGACLAAPPSVPAPASDESNPALLPGAALIRRGAEIYLRDRAVQLREELALGAGPLIRGLAAIRGVDPQRLGRMMRANRTELTKLIGGGWRAEWAGDFLRRVDALELERSHS